MIIAIPSVTTYINNSRKSAYIDTAKETVSGARNVVNEGNLGMFDTNTTYYIPANYFKTEGALKSPYREFTQAYIGVIYTGTGYSYYWISVDCTGQGIDEIKPYDRLDVDDIKSNLKSETIENIVKTIGIGNRSIIKILNPENSTWKGYAAEGNVSEEGGKAKINQIPTCPDCAFTFTEEGIYTVWNTSGAEPTVFQSSDYKEVKQIFDDIGEMFYGVVLNENNQVERAYVCGEIMVKHSV